MNHEQWGRWILALGAGILVLGAAVYFFGGKLGWFGRLPGDLSYESENVRFYFPLTTLVIVNAAIWGLIRLVAWISDLRKGQPPGSSGP